MATLRPFASLERGHALHETVRGEVRKVRWRCRAAALLRGDCSQHRQHGSAYCYYHTKVARGQIEPRIVKGYPLLPLPEYGYYVKEGTHA